MLNKVKKFIDVDSDCRANPSSDFVNIFAGLFWVGPILPTDRQTDKPKANGDINITCSAEMITRSNGASSVCLSSTSPRSIGKLKRMTIVLGGCLSVCLSAVPVCKWIDDRKRRLRGCFQTNDNALSIAVSLDTTGTTFWCLLPIPGSWPLGTRPRHFYS